MFAKALSKRDPVDVGGFQAASRHIEDLPLHVILPLTWNPQQAMQLSMGLQELEAQAWQRRGSRSGDPQPVATSHQGAHVCAYTALDVAEVFYRACDRSDPGAMAVNSLEDMRTYENISDVWDGGRVDARGARAFLWLAPLGKRLGLLAEADTVATSHSAGEDEANTSARKRKWPNPTGGDLEPAAATKKARARAMQPSAALASSQGGAQGHAVGRKAPGSGGGAAVPQCPSPRRSGLKPLSSSSRCTCLRAWRVCCVGACGWSDIPEPG